MGKNYQVLVLLGFRGEKLLIDLGNTEEMKRFTVGQLKEKIAEKLPGAAELWAAGDERVRLLFMDKQLEGDTSLLSEYGIQHMSVIQMVIFLPGGGCLEPPHPHTDDGLGDKEGETRRSKECLSIPMSKTENKFSVGPK
uniref:Ubiquitin-like domain-containing protein n=1 Tax=Poecilia latipinna TaxID=48699 RepID=A0A3B3U629_9TELE